MSDTRVAPEVYDLADPHLNGGRNPKNAPKPKGHFAANMTIVIALIMGLPLAYMLLR